MAGLLGGMADSATNQIVRPGSADPGAWMTAAPARVMGSPLLGTATMPPIVRAMLSSSQEVRNVC